MIISCMSTLGFWQHLPPSLHAPKQDVYLNTVTVINVVIDSPAT